VGATNHVCCHQLWATNSCLTNIAVKVKGQGQIRRLILHLSYKRDTSSREMCSNI